jgi:hypothetical protein
VASEAEADRRRALMVVHAACMTAIGRLDPDDLDQLGLIVRLQEICEMVEADLKASQARTRFA